MRLLPALCLLFAAPAWAETPKNFTGPWDVKALEAVEVKPTWGETVGKSREVYYPGEPFGGKPTRVFAYYAKPEGVGPFPGVVLVHGGGGKAFRAWAEHWAANGYCALAMDLAGHGPKGRLPDGGPEQGDGDKFKPFDDDTAREMWTYHAIADVILGHNLLRSFPEVDKERTAVTGISWGGYLTCIVAGLDHRFKAAVPVYGCGFLHENSVWKPNHFDKFDAARRDLWVKNFDPSSYLASATCPMLFLNGTNDFAYPLDSYKKSYELVRSPRTISVRVRLPHGHIWTNREVDVFIDSHLKKGVPLPSVTAMKRDGDTVTAGVDSKTKIKSAQLNYAVAEGAWQKREWKTIPAEMHDGSIIAKLPEARPLAYYVSVIDERGLESASPHEVIRDLKP